MKARAVFSWVITANGTEITKFNNASMGFAVDGIGTAGIVSLYLSFSVPVSEYVDYENIFEGGALTFVNGYASGIHSFISTDLYISSKSCDGDIVNVKCYDRMTYAEADFPCTEAEFYDRDGNEIEMAASTVVSRIGQAMMLSTFFDDTSALNVFTARDGKPGIPKSLLYGKTCRDVMGTFAQAFCGVWHCSRSTLVFLPFGSGYAEVSTSAQYHEKLRRTSHRSTSYLYMTGGGQEFGNPPADSSTVSISTPLACGELYSAVSSRISVTYEGYDCRNAYIGDLPMYPMSCTFAQTGESLYVNYCTVKLTKKGALASLGMNRVDEGEWVYKDRTRRELDSRYKDGDLWGSTEITKKDGVKHVYINENNGTREKHGYEARQSGVTVYDGDMVDKVPGEEITPGYDENDDVKTVTYTKDGVKTVLEITWDGDKIKSYKRKKTKVINGREVVILEDSGEAPQP